MRLGLGWTLLLPFSLLNMAYWSRRLMKPGRSPHNAWHNAGGAGLIRLSALALTLLMATTVSVLSLDVVGVQCYTGPTCSKFPSAIGFFGALAAGTAAGADEPRAGCGGDVSVCAHEHG